MSVGGWLSGAGGWLSGLSTGGGGEAMPGLGIIPGVGARGGGGGRVGPGVGASLPQNSYAGSGQDGDESATPELSQEEQLLQSQAEISRGLWDQYKQFGTPIISKLFDEATKPISDAAFAAESGRAGADVDQSYDRATTEFRGELGRYGLNPGSGRYASGLRSLSLGRAASRAGAMTGAQRHLRDRQTQLKFGTLSAVSGHPSTALYGLSSAAGGHGSIADRAERAQYNRQQSKDNERSGFGQLLGTGLTAAATLFSDRRVKDDMGMVGKLDSGIPVHIFRYKDSPKVHMGVMADEAEKIRPEAVGRHKSGLRVVDYLKVAA